MDNVEQLRLRQFQLVAKAGRAEHIIANYQEGISFYISRLTNYFDIIGHLSERMGDPEPEELS
jgi:hypothetical protein